MFKTIIFVLRFILICWWAIPIVWLSELLMTANLDNANEMAGDIFYGRS